MQNCRQIVFYLLLVADIFKLEILLELKTLVRFFHYFLFIHYYFKKGVLEISLKVVDSNINILKLNRWNNFPQLRIKYFHGISTKYFALINN